MRVSAVELITILGIISSNIISLIALFIAVRANKIAEKPIKEYLSLFEKSSDAIELLARRLFALNDRLKKIFDLLKPDDFSDNKEDNQTR